MRLFSPSMKRGFDGNMRNFTDILVDKKARITAVILMLNLVCTAFLLVTATSTNSMALTAFAYLTIFDILCLCTGLLSFWISHQHPTQDFSFGFDRYEVLSVFVCTTLTQLGSVFICKESVERLFQPQHVEAEGQLPVMFFGLIVHLLVIYGVTNKPFSQVSTVAASNWLQETIQDLGKNVCGIAPVFSKYLLHRLDPYALLGEFAALVVLIEVVLVEKRNSGVPDAVCGIVIAFFTCITMFPLGVYSGMILLQGTSTNLSEHLDKFMREVNTLEGVLEIKNEHFWNIGFSKIACSFHVRVRRDAEEQAILADIVHRLSPSLHHLAIQIFKDDWITSSASYTSLPLSNIQEKDFKHKIDFNLG